MSCNSMEKDRPNVSENLNWSDQLGGPPPAYCSLSPYLAGDGLTSVLF